jgi:hypothetical protein
MPREPQFWRCTGLVCVCVCSRVDLPCQADARLVRTPLGGCLTCNASASLAQLVEHALRKRMVMGSIPIGGFLPCRAVPCGNSSQEGIRLENNSQKAEAPQRCCECKVFVAIRFADRRTARHHAPYMARKALWPTSRNQQMSGLRLSTASCCPAACAEHLSVCEVTVAPILTAGVSPNCLRVRRPPTTPTNKNKCAILQIVRARSTALQSLRGWWWSALRWDSRRHFSQQSKSGAV